MFRKKKSHQKTEDDNKQPEVEEQRRLLNETPSSMTPAQESTTTTAVDDDTVQRSNNTTTTNTTSVPSSSSSSSKKSKAAATTTTPKSIEEQLEIAKQQIATEKAGKRKLFHSLVKLANELRKTRESIRETPAWYEGGMWRAPAVLPGLAAQEHEQQNKQQQQQKIQRREAISLSDLFFHLVIVTSFTRVGTAISGLGYLDARSLLYFAVFWNVWSKEASYSTRFDTTDLSAQVVTLVTCFAALFASLSVQASLQSVDGTRIMIMAAFVAILHCSLHIRVALSCEKDTALGRHVWNYAIFIIVMSALEATVWLVGVFVFPVDWNYRWCIFLGGILLSFRVPRAFMANDFHAAISKRGVLFILLLGFMLQQIIVVASDFFAYQTPTYEHYAFIGAACLLFFCIKLLYIDDTDTLAEDHAVLVNRFAGFFFNIGQFSLLLSTTVMGSGLNLLTHEYLAATAALPGPSKTLVCGGFSAVLFSNFFIKSLHVKRVPIDPRDRGLFVGAYVIQALVTLCVVIVTAAMCLGVFSGSGFIGYLMQTDIQLLYVLSGAALFVVVMSWLDEGVELTLYESVADSRGFRVSPFGWWWCLHTEVTDEDLAAQLTSEQENQVGRMSHTSSVTSTTRLSVLSPLLGSSLADLRNLQHEMGGYESINRQDYPVGRMV